MSSFRDIDTFFFFWCQASRNELKRHGRHQWLGNSGWHIGHDKRSTVSAVVAVTGSDRVVSTTGWWEEALLSLWVLEAFQKVFSKLCVGTFDILPRYLPTILKKSTLKCVFRNDRGDPICSPKAPQGTVKSFVLVSLPPLASFSPHNGVHRVKRKEKGVKGP